MTEIIIPNDLSKPINSVSKENQIEMSLDVTSLKKSNIETSSMNNSSSAQRILNLI